VVEDISAPMPANKGGVIEINAAPDCECTHILPKGNRVMSAALSSKCFIARQTGAHTDYFHHGNEWQNDHNANDFAHSQ
jgi:hypothetical protein